MMWVWRERLARTKGNEMIIKDAKQLIQSQNLTEPNFADCRTIYDRHYTYIPTAIITKEVRTGYNYKKAKDVTFFVAKKIEFRNNGTWFVCDQECLIPTAKCDSTTSTVRDIAMARLQDQERKLAMANRVASLPPTTEIADALGIGNATVSYDSRYQKFTITLSLAQMEALLGQDVN